MMIEDIELDFWTEPNRIGEPVDVLVPPHKLNMFRARAANLDIPVVVRDDNIQRVIDEEFARLSKKESKALDLNDWNDFDTIETYLEDLEGNCAAGVTCTLSSIGKTYEGRDMLLFKVSTGGADKQAVWLDSAIHAREWLAPATLLNILDRIATGSDTAETDMRSKNDFYFLPVMNPDGYQYSFTAGNRLNRKNRAPNPGSSCLGTDLNRNYDHMWGMEGVSKNPCSDIFCGSSGGSELETQAVQIEAARIGNTIDGWITFHSYGYMWMHPWGNTVNNAGFVCERASDHDDMFALADKTADAIEAVHNTRWARGTSCEVIYETTGATDDYVKAKQGIKYSVNPELRGNSFVVDASQIKLSYEEVWAGLVVYCANL
jgi:carboxypeptidase A2